MPARLAPPPRRGEWPRPPRLDLWPEALRSAERLRGTLLPCGPGLRGAGWPETPTVRAAALAPWLGGGLVATHLTAAWIWGAARSPGRPLRVTTPARRRNRATATELLRVSELRCPEADTQHLGGFAVTTPMRTACDLLHDPEGFGAAERVACRLLFHAIEGGAAAVARRLGERPRPHRRLARARLAALAAPAADGSSRR